MGQIQSIPFIMPRHKSAVVAESVVILVSHGAGCNAMIGAITHQPVLADVSMSSLTMAVRRPGKNHMEIEDLATPQGATPSTAIPQIAKSTAYPKGIVAIPDFYELKMMGSTDHIRSTATTPSSSRSNSMSYPPLPAVGLRRESGGAQMSGRRPDWARAYDPNRHEEAVTVSSVSLNE